MAAPAFLTGSTMRHVLVMTGASSVGLIAMFGVDVIDLYFLTLLDEQAILAAVGFGGALLYFLMSLGIGLQIALGALVARSEGAGDREQAGRYCSSALWFNTLSGSLLAALAWWQLPELLSLLGASGDSLDYALRYTRIQLPAVPLLILGISLGAGLRAVGDARHYMLATVGGAVANAVLDPIFIFTFGWGLEGAAWASVAARAVTFVISGWYLFRVHRLPSRVSVGEVVADVRPILVIGLPAVLTNFATPLGNGVILRLISDFGEGAVAAYTVLGRILPVAFAAVFAVSGAVGPVIAQNAGACQYGRVRETLGNAAFFVIAYVSALWLLLWLMSGYLVQWFAVTELAGELIDFYVTFIVGAFALNGLLFVSNASFNNLGRAYVATLFNYAKVFLGMVPAAYFLAGVHGARGVMIGEAVGMSVFGVLGMATAVLFVRKLESDYAPLPAGDQAAPP